LDLLNFIQQAHTRPDGRCNAHAAFLGN